LELAKLAWATPNLPLVLPYHGTGPCW
jgi:hypothetical protein